MPETTWSAVDDYLIQALAPEAADLAWALEANAISGLPAIDVSPTQGKLLQLIAAMIGARRILEIGTLGGYSTLWMARALPPEGRIVTLELDPRHASIARDNFRRANLSDRIDLREGPAMESLHALIAANAPQFDFAFVDADKPNNPLYFNACMKLVRPGGVILFDNVVREGAVIDEFSDDPRVLGVRQLFEMIAAEPRASATALQTVGSKGYDGLLLLRIRNDAA
ncbi:MAG TPA: O-methyltransferase [Phycisphaerae bacterium]|nr:O-methyltransferase [Phycisphaerae bacterium]HRW53581.1 O-methyltransferase [Phycisphaerae bacterium]